MRIPTFPCGGPGGRRHGLSEETNKRIAKTTINAVQMALVGQDVRVHLKLSKQGCSRSGEIEGLAACSIRQTWLGQVESAITPCVTL